MFKCTACSGTASQESIQTARKHSEQTLPRLIWSITVHEKLVSVRTVFPKIPEICSSEWHDVVLRGVCTPACTADTLAPASEALLWPMMSGARQLSQWLKPCKIASIRRVRKFCRRSSNCEDFATRLRSTVPTPPIQTCIYTEYELFDYCVTSVKPAKPRPSLQIDFVSILPFDLLGLLYSDVAAFQALKSAGRVRNRTTQ